MRPFSEKIFLQLTMPTEENTVSDHARIRLALETLGYSPVSFPLQVVQQMYPLCREANFDITVTLVYQAHGWIATRVEAGNTCNFHYGLAVDYGSTTIVMQLVDLVTGTVLAEEKTFNGQSVYGMDILSRITYGMEGEENKAQLQQVTVRSFEALLEQLTRKSGIRARELSIMVVSGNTTMIHFLLGLDAWTVFASPYAPVIAEPDLLWGREVGMDFLGLLCFVPAASNYVGGDVVSGLLTVDLHKQEQTALFFDIGTNGELVLGNRDWILAGAGAAGPALEGYISRFGMRAAEGAVDSVRIRGDRLEFTTIGGQKPVGICGSGIMDLLAQMRRSGWINIAGELQPERSERVIYLPQEGQYAVVYATPEESESGQSLFFTQTDIAQYLDTKAAAYTMVECILESAGVAAEDLRHCYLTGAFAVHGNLESAITIGMFPDLPRQRYTVLDNTSLAGARALLLDRQKQGEAQWLAEHIYAVQFASIPDFLVRMQAAKFIPHTDMRRYPSVAAQLEGAAVAD